MRVASVLFLSFFLFTSSLVFSPERAVYERSPAQGQIQKVGILFGTFDPPHLGHKSLARAMQRKFGLDVVYFIPRDKADYKPNKQPIGIRNQMIELMLADEPKLKLIPAEVARKMKDIRSNEAFKVLRESFPADQVSLILGDDTLASLHHNQVKIPQGFQLLVSRREGNEHLELPSSLDGKPVHLLKVSEESSSTEVRKILSEGAQPEMLPYNVFQFIKQRGLYNYPLEVLPAPNGNCHEMIRSFSN